MGIVPSTPSLEHNNILQKLIVDRRQDYAPTCLLRSNVIHLQLLLKLSNLQCKTHRGGYCFEHNGLFAAVLRSLGYELYEAAARVARSFSEETGLVCLTVLTAL